MMLKHGKYQYILIHIFYTHFLSHELTMILKDKINIKIGD
jgi:hypothetical protein